MDMKYDDTKVIVFHYSDKKAVLSNIVKRDKERVAIELPWKNLKAYINEGDPMVIIHKADSSEYQLKGCNVIGILESKSLVGVKLDIEVKGRNYRVYERLPVSISVDIKDSERKKRYSGIIKDISKNGLLIYSKETIPVDSHVEIDIFLENATFFFGACVVRKFENPYYNCFGLSIPGEDLISRNNLYKCLKQICEGYMKMLMEEFNIFISFDNFEYPNNHTGNNEEQMLDKSAMKLEEILKRSKH